MSEIPHRGYLTWFFHCSLETLAPGLGCSVSVESLEFFISIDDIDVSRNRAIFPSSVSWEFLQN